LAVCEAYDDGLAEQIRFIAYLVPSITIGEECAAGPPGSVAVRMAT